jgi:PPIC-type PPIASE domain
MGREYGRQLRITLGLCGAVALGVWLGRGGAVSDAHAGPPGDQSTPPSDYSQRVVAYIYGNVPITREDLGEYLIARKGADSVELLVNKRIIEHACREAGIEVSAAEVKAAFEQDCEVMSVKREEFISRVLKQYGKTLYEWHEDVLKPRLMLQKFCQKRITVNDEDLRKEFESRYGEKVECRIIIWPKGEEKIALREFDDLRKGEENFARKAANQAISSLAAVGGRIQPIARYSGAHPKVEEWAFKLQPGEISELIATPDGTVCIKVDRKLPADDKTKLDDVREQLHKAVFDKKISQEIPIVMKDLREKAKPTIILKKATTQKEMEEEVLQELQQTGAIKK